MTYILITALDFQQKTKSQNTDLKISLLELNVT